MKKIICALLVLLAAPYLNAQNTRSNCPVKPETFVHQNPDGSQLTLSTSGSELVSYFETIEGYTVLERADGFYEYATKNAENNLVGSGLIARNGEPVLNKSLTPHLRYSDTQFEILSSAFYQINPENLKKAGNKPFPSKGKRRVLALLIEYPDLKSTFPKQNFDSMMVKRNYNNNGSFRDYYLKTSFGQLELNVDVFGWYMATSGYLNYGKSSPGYNTNVGNLIKRAVLAADSAGVDFSKYDNDSDGYVDGIIIMHAGIGAEEQSAPSPNNYIWSHRYNLSYTVGSVYVDGVYVNSYGIFPEKRYNGGSYSQVGIGVITHEFGHILDLPDLYSTQDNGEGAGNFANMAGGPWLNGENTPPYHDAWSRVQMGWMAATVISSSGQYTIPKGVADSNFAYRINTSRANEYFLLENRQKKGFDRYLPSKGLAIWHINSNTAKVLSLSGSNNVNNDTSAYGVGLLQADGRRDLEIGNNRGDGGDLYPGTSNNHTLNSTSKPNSSLYYKVGGIKQPSLVSISNINMNADSSVTFTVGNRPTAGFDAVPLSGCVPLSVDFINTSSFSSNYLWKFSDTTLNTTQLSKTFTTSGTFPVTLFVLDSLNNPIDSFTQTITVAASPDAIYKVTRTDSNSFILNDKSIDALFVSWRFGTSQSSTSPNLTYKITGNADIPFKLIAYSSNDCTDTASGVLSYWPLAVKELTNEIEITAYPNPFQNELTLKLNLSNPKTFTVNFTDILGNIIWKKNLINLTSGSNQINIPVNDLPKGIYLIEMKSDNFHQVFKVSNQ